MIDEPVHVSEYRQEWPELFARERDRIVTALSIGAAQVAHIGSTAVEGMMAKPIVDLMIGMPVHPPPVQMADGLTSLGYDALGEAGVPGRQYFRIRGAQAFNVHVVQLDGPLWVSNMALREYLRAHPRARARYAAAKLAAIESGATHLLGYSQAKAGMLAELMPQALAFHTHDDRAGR